VYFVKERNFEFNQSELPSFKKVSQSVASNYPFWIVFGSILILGSTTVMLKISLIYLEK
jgi:hypothetical protein